MSNKPHDDGNGESAFEARLRGCLPASLPDGFVMNLEARVVARGSWKAANVGWLAVAALLVAGLWLGLVVPEQPREGGRDHVQKPSDATSLVLSDSSSTGDALVEMTDVVGAEDVGTVPSDEGLYQIVRVMLVHRTVERGVEADVLRVISEQTSEQYVAVPLEIF